MESYHRDIVEATGDEEKKKAEYRMYKAITDRLELVRYSHVIYD